MVDITLTNGQVIQRSPGWVSLMKLKPGDEIAFHEELVLPEDVIMEIKKIEEIMSPSRDIYWIAYFMPVDPYIHIEATKVIFNTRPRIGNKLNFELVYGGMGNPSYYEPEFSSEMKFQKKVRNLFSAIIQSNDTVNYTDRGGIEVHFRESGIKYIVQFSENSIEKVRNARLTIHVYHPTDGYYYIYDTNQDGSVDFGTDRNAEKFFMQVPSSFPTGDGFQHKPHWQKKMNDALEETLKHFGIHYDNTSTNLF